MNDPLASTAGRHRFWIALGSGVVLGIVVALLTGRLRYGVLTLFMTVAVIVVVWTFAVLWGYDPDQTATHATREDVGPVLNELILVGILTASIAAIGLLLVASTGGTRVLDGVLAISTVLSMWTMLHTVYAMRYARLYYRHPPGGIDFNTEVPPKYSDFFYFSFNLGMTYQVSDTSVQTSEIRETVLRHTIMSYVFGTLVLATTINLVLGVVAS